MPAASDLVEAVRVIGAGPAGCAAALQALRQGLAVTLYDKSAFPRHKVCGEFLSPEIEPVLRRLGVWDAFLAAGPARLRRVVLHFGSREKRWSLDSPAWGLSRFALDHILLRAAVSAGAGYRRELAGVACREISDRSKSAETSLGTADMSVCATSIVAHGRKAAASKGGRLFGFKAHFRGECDDAVHLYFFDGCYAGVSAVEGGAVNICGLAPEGLLAACRFDPARVLSGCPPLAERMQPLQRSMDWLTTGPLVFSETLRCDAAQPVYYAGDALGFIDPFTGSGIASALLTGAIAAQSAAGQVPPCEHLRRCRAALGGQYRMSALVRAAIERGWAEHLAPVFPGKLLFEWTRPSFRQLEAG
jgi:glucose inhibited division protein A